MIGLNLVQFPTLFSQTKTGALQSWRVWTDGATIYTEFGAVGGKLQVTTGRACAAAHAGSSQARTAEEQAQFTARAMHQHKLSRKYALDAAGAQTAKLDLPMLAHRFDQRAKHITYPCDVQPKLDGNRAIARRVDGDVVLVTRSGVATYDLPHLQAALRTVLDVGSELDGELYVHGVSPQTINSWVQKEHPESVRVQFYVYDMPAVRGQTDLVWKARRDALQVVARRFPSSVVLVPSLNVNSAAEIEAAFEQYVRDGYEGAMVRNRAGTYLFGDRSTDLQKVKMFEDAEFEVVGCESGVGKMQGCAVWICKVSEGKGAGKTFKCVMKVPLEKRRAHYENWEAYVGRMMTVSYFGFFDTGLPRFPRGVKFRSSHDK